MSSSDFMETASLLCENAELHKRVADLNEARCTLASRMAELTAQLETRLTGECKEDGIQRLVVDPWVAWAHVAEQRVRDLEAAIRQHKTEMKLSEPAPCDKVLWSHVREE